jgi:hypothetical protein
VTSKEEAQLTEKIAMAIAQADERNGAPPYEQRMAMGKWVREHLYDEAEAVVDLLRDLQADRQGMR